MPANQAKTSRKKSAKSTPGLTGLTASARRVAAAGVFADVVRVTVTEARRLFGATHVSLWLTEAGGTFSRMDPGRDAYRLDPTLGKRLLRSQKAAALEVRKPATLRRMMGVPLRLVGRPMGVLLIADGDTTPYARDALVFAEAYATQVTLALANSTHIAQLLDSNAALERQARKLQQLYQVLERFSQDRNEQEALTRVTKLAVNALEYNYAVLHTLDGNYLRFYDVAARKPADPNFADMVREMRARRVTSDKLAAESLKTGQPVAIDHPKSDPRIKQGFSRQNFQNLAAVPLTIRHKPVAVLYVAHHTGGPPITPGDLELLGVFSRICDYALTTTRHETHRRRGIDISRLPARNLDEFLRAVVKQLPGVVAATEAVISIPDEDCRLIPRAATDRKYLGKTYRDWVGKLEFSREKLAVAAFPGGSDNSPELIHGSIAAPIRQDAEHLGLVHVFGRPAGPFTEEDTATLQAVAARIGYVLKNLELVDSLRDERQQFASIVRGSADGILSLDSRERIEFFNPAMEDLTGYHEPEVTGRTWAEVLEPRNERGRPIELADLLDERTAGRTVSNVTVLTKSGTRRWVGVSASPDSEDPRQQHLILVIRDITEQYEVQKRQNEFVSIASHELRTPITALMGYLSLVQNRETLAPEQSERFLDRAFAAANRLSDLVEDLLNVARIEEGRLTVNLKPVNPTAVLEEVVAGSLPSAEQKDLQLVIRNRLSERDVIRADASKLTQVFANLLDNAIKYTPAGRAIYLTARPSARYVSVTFRDTGIGIHESNLHRIFDKFFREYTELSVAAGGTGLGLFITKELVELQGGTLTIRSKQNEGTTAVVRFPRYRPDESSVASKQT